MEEYNNHKPIYKQLEETFIKNIKDGIWPVHSKIKDEIELAKELKVSRGTLRKAIKILVEKKLVNQIKGKGTFILSSDMEQPLATRFISFSEAMAEKGLSYKTMLISKEIMTPDIKVAAFLDVPQDEKVVYIERVRLVENYPIIYLKNYIQLSNCPGIMDDDLEKETIFSLIEKKYKHKIDWGRRYFKAVPAMDKIAFNLGLNIGTPVMYLEQVAYTNPNKPIEYSNVWINSNKFEISSFIIR